MGISISFIVGTVVGWYVRKMWDDFENRPSNHEPASPPRSTLNLSNQEGYEATSAASSVISGVKTTSETEVQDQLDILGKKGMSFEFKDVYGRLNTSKIDDSSSEEKPLYYNPAAYHPKYDRDFTDYKGDDDTSWARVDHPYKDPVWVRSKNPYITHLHEPFYCNPDSAYDHRHVFPDFANYKEDDDTRDYSSHTTRPVGGNRKAVKKIYSPPPTASPPRPISKWSVEEKNEATAAAFSAISGVTIISEKDVQKQRDQGKKVTPLEIKDVFYGQLNTSQIKDKKQQPLYYIPDSAYDPKHDYDFTNYKGDDTRCVRGDYRYTRPAGWNRKAVKVSGKYEDDVWLGQGGWRDTSSPGEWPVSYHGTKIQNVSSIVKGGYDTGRSKRQMYGPGIYSTPDINVAEGYATEFNYKGENYKCVLQNRVDLKKTNQVQTGYDGIYFVTPDVNDIRPYGVCLKKI